MSWPALALGLALALALAPALAPALGIGGAASAESERAQVLGEFLDEHWRTLPLQSQGAAPEKPRRV